jgi:predicted NUDIX family phosphoesterase
MSETEEVLCVRSRDFYRIGYRNGESRLDTDPDRMAALMQLPFHYVPRDIVEYDLSYKQFVVYCLVAVHSGDFAVPPHARLFAYERPGKAEATGEPRLAGLLSIGVGGHVTREDTRGREGFAGLAMARSRELHEEIAYTPADGYQWGGDWIGIIHDESNLVGVHHVGLAGMVFAGPGVAPKVPDQWPWHGLIDHKFVIENFNRFEQWSRLMLSEYVGCYPGDGSDRRAENPVKVVSP